MSSALGVYISVPFCKAKCTFCNFASGAFAPERMHHYVDHVCAEIAESRSLALKRGAEIPDLIDTIYFGGGTPSLLAPAQIGLIFDRLHAEFSFAPRPEITLECAPGQLSDVALSEWQRQGMNRISFGVQSFVDLESAAVGRLHTEQTCLDELAHVRAAGVDDINIDLIVGLPHQTEASWTYSLQAAIDTGAPHVSVYMLEVDVDSRLGKEMLSSGNRYSASAVPSDDETAAWYQIGCDALNSAGVAQYEISNFARSGRQSLHNLKYWQRQPYLGIGLDAHSMLQTKIGAIRFANTSDLDTYSGDLPTTPLQIYQESPNAPELDFIGMEQAFEESLFLGLRLNEGVSIAGLRRQFGDAMLNDTLSALHEVSGAGLVEMASDKIRLTSRGRMVSNEVFSRLLLSTAV